MIDKLVDECGETIDEEVKIVSEIKNKCNACIVYIVVFSILFIINIGIATYFVYLYWYLKNDSRHVDFNARKETTIY